MGYLINATSSGIYTPTLNNALNACSNPIISNAYFSQINNIITVTIEGNIDLDFSSVNTGSFDFTYPIIPTNTNSIGVCNVNVPNNINAIVKSNTITFFSDDILLILSGKFNAIFQYQI